MKIISKPLPEFCYSGRALQAVDGVVTHYFSARNVEEEAKHFDPECCYNLFVDLNRAKAEREHYMQGSRWPDGRMYASAHVLIDREGQVYQLMDFGLQAYHAGASMLNGRAHCNRWTLGVELIGDQHSGFSREQYLALVELLLQWEEEHGFARDNVVGHDMVRWQAIQAEGAGSKLKAKYDPSGRKDGRGDNFDWWYVGKLWNDRRANPAGVAGLDQLDEILAAQPECDSHRP